MLDLELWVIIEHLLAKVSFLYLVSGERSLEKKLERNPSVMSRKELIKQECNLLLETRLPNIMSLMNSEKNIGLNLGFFQER